MTLLAALLAATLGVTAVPEPELSVLVSPSTAAVGDLVTISLELALPAGETAVLPRWGESWGEAEIRDVGPVERQIRDNLEITRQRVVVTFFRPGDFELPRPDVTLVGVEGERAVETSSDLRVSVVSVLPQAEEALQLQPPRPPRPLEWSRSFVWVAGLLALSCIAGLVVLARRTRAVQALDRAAVDPLTELRRGLAILERETAVAAFFEGLSQSLRRFLGASLSFPALESTTTEIRAHLKARELPIDLITRSDRLLGECDAVKFARKPVAEERIGESLLEVEELATTLVELLMPRIEEDQEAAA